MARVFLSYARVNLKYAKKLYDCLVERTEHEIWFDKTSFIPGTKWEPAIRKAIRESRFFIAMFSQKSVSESGFRRSELRQALEMLSEFPDNEIFPSCLNR